MHIINPPNTHQIRGCLVSHVVMYDSYWLIGYLPVVTSVSMGSHILQRKCGVVQLWQILTSKALPTLWKWQTSLLTMFPPLFTWIWQVLPLVNWGANSGIAGSDCCIIEVNDQPQRFVNVEGIDGHVMTKRWLITAGAVTDMNRGPIILIMNQ
jgi:hypothetical protein